MKIKLILVLLCCTSILAAQNNYEIFNQIIEVYQGNQNLSFQIDYYYYDNLNASQPIDSLTMKVSQHNKNFYFQTREYEMLATAQLSLTLDHKEKVIVVQPASNQASRIGMDIEKWQQTAEQMGLHLEQTATKQPYHTLTFVETESSDSRIDFIYDPENYRLMEMNCRISVEDAGYEFNHSQFNAIYSNYRVSSKRFPYTSSQFVTQTNGHYKATKKYRDYRVIKAG